MVGGQKFCTVTMNLETYSTEQTSNHSEDKDISTTENTLRAAESRDLSGLSKEDREAEPSKQETVPDSTPHGKTDQQHCDNIVNDSLATSDQLKEFTVTLPTVTKPVQSRRHRSRISYGRKKELCLYKMEHPKASLTHITKYFSKKWSTHVGRTTVCDILLHSKKWLSIPSDCHDMLRNTPPKYIRLDNALYSWYVEARKKYGSLTNEILVAKAKELGRKLNITDLSYSNGWLYSFKRRHRLLNLPTQTPSNLPIGRQYLSMGSIFKQMPSFKRTSPKGPGMNRTNNKCSKTSFGRHMDNNEGNELNLTGFPENVTFSDACQGLLTVISFLEGHQAIGGDYIPLLWQLFQHICSQTQIDLLRAKCEQLPFGENGYQVSSNSDQEIANELMFSERCTKDVVGEGDHCLTAIKKEQIDPQYEQALSAVQMDQSHLSMAVSAQSSHQCSRCGQQFRVLTELLDHMTGHALAAAPSLGPGTTCTANENSQGQQLPGDCPWNISKQGKSSESSCDERGSPLPDIGCPKSADCNGEAEQLDLRTGCLSEAQNDSKPIDVMNDAQRSQAFLSQHMENNTDSHSAEGEESGKGKGAMNELELLKAMHKKSYTCDICGKKFNNYSNFRRHVRLHSGRKPYKCSVCGKGFADGSALQKHATVHTGEKPYLCTICGKGLTQAAGLVLHMRQHTGERPYKCSVCGKDFTQSSSLKDHMRIHTGERPYRCTICGKHFPRSGDLGAHIRMHTGEKPFQCNVCGKCFTQRGNLSKHSRSHTGEKPYKCSTCEKSFSEKCLLTAHIRVHTGERPFCCTLCGKTFSQSGSLFHHMKMHK